MPAGKRKARLSSISDETVQQIIEMRDSGLSWGAIGNRLGLSDMGCKTAHMRVTDPEAYEELKIKRNEQYGRRVSSRRPDPEAVDFDLWISAYRSVTAASKLSAA
jgi:hypothetical protein